MKKIKYITHDAWWNSDLPILSKISLYFTIDVFVFSSIYYNKQYPIKKTEFAQNIYEFERKYRLKNIFSAFSAYTLFNAVKRSHKEDDILYYVFGNDFYFNFFFLLFARSKKTIICFHNYNDHSDSPFFERYFKNLYVKSFTNFHFQSKSQYEQFISKHSFKNAFYTDMPSKDFGRPQGKVNIRKKDKKIFLFFGFIRDYKRLDLFIEAANLTQSNAQFVIAGNCNNWERYKNKINDEEKFTCNINFIDNSEIADYFTQADFLVLPYSDTTQSGPLHIACKYYLPIIVSDLEGFTSIIRDNYNGYVFKNGDSKDLSRVFDMAASLSNEEYLKLKENQKRFEEAYSLKEKTIGEKFQVFVNSYLA